MYELRGTDSCDWPKTGLGQKVGPMKVTETGATGVAPA